MKSAPSRLCALAVTSASAAMLFGGLLLVVPLCSAHPIVSKLSSTTRGDGFAVGDALQSYNTSKHVGALELGDITIVSVTDVHSWLSGHRHPDNDPLLDADYGDLRSFYDHLSVTASSMRKDVFLFNSGDLVDGTGLSDASQVHGEDLTPLIQMMPFSALVIGNHELYQDETIEHMVHSGFFDHWNGRYLTSNVVYSDSKEPLGSRYVVLTGPNTGKKVLVYGFLYNFNGNCPSTVVEDVEQVIAERWFRESLKSEESFEAIVVLAHMDVADALVTIITREIRSYIAEDTPVVVLAGHTHYRGFRNNVAEFKNSISFEAGKYLDTVGVVSLSRSKENDELKIEHTFLDATQEKLIEASGKTSATFPTRAGEELREAVQAARKKLGLDDVMGCAEITYTRNANFGDEASLWRLLMTDILPLELFTPRNNPGLVAIQSSGGLRYDLYKGEITKDDCFTISPFRDRYHILSVTLSYNEVWEVINGLGTSSHRYTPVDRAEKQFSIITLDYDLEKVVSQVEKVAGERPKALPYREDETDSSLIFQQYAKNFMPCSSMGQK